MSDMPTAMQLFAAEFIRELKPMLAKIQLEQNPNELLSVNQLTKELGIGPVRVKALIKAGTLRTAQDTNLVSRRELERFTAGRKR